jgi:hypothetical protein
MYNTSATLTTILANDSIENDLVKSFLEALDHLRIDLDNNVRNDKDKDNTLDNNSDFLLNSKLVRKTK